MLDVEREYVSLRALLILAGSCEGATRLRYVQLSFPVLVSTPSMCFLVDAGMGIVCGLCSICFRFMSIIAPVVRPKVTCAIFVGASEVRRQLICMSNNNDKDELTIAHTNNVDKITKEDADTDSKCCLNVAHRVMHAAMFAPNEPVPQP